jgi:hypothetical protein
MCGFVYDEAEGGVPDLRAASGVLSRHLPEPIFLGRPDKPAYNSYLRAAGSSRREAGWRSWRIVNE